MIPCGDTGSQLVSYWFDWEWPLCLCLLREMKPVTPWRCARTVSIFLFVYCHQHCIYKPRYYIYALISAPYVTLHLGPGNFRKKFNPDNFHWKTKLFRRKIADKYSYGELNATSDQTKMKTKLADWSSVVFFYPECDIWFQLEKQLPYFLDYRVHLNIIRTYVNFQ